MSDIIHECVLGWRKILCDIYVTLLHHLITPTILNPFTISITTFTPELSMWILPLTFYNLCIMTTVYFYFLQAQQYARRCFEFLMIPLENTSSVSLSALSIVLRGVLWCTYIWMLSRSSLALVKGKCKPAQGSFQKNHFLVKLCLICWITWKLLWEKQLRIR